MRIGFKLSQMIDDLAVLLETWDAGEELEVFDSGWIFDHFVALNGARGPSHEALTLAGALAARSRRLQLGHLVLGNTYRHPAVVANAAVTLDHLAPGRFVLGLGAGWHEEEHAMYGMPLPPIGERISMLESAVRVIKALFAQPDGVTLDAPPYRLSDARLDPPPLTAGGPPVWLGTQGLRRGLRIVAQYADGWNQTQAPETFPAKRDALLRHCEAIGRDPSEIEISAQVFVRDGSREALEVATRYVEQGVGHVILVVPVDRGPDGLRRVAREVAEPLRERHG